MHNLQFKIIPFNNHMVKIRVPREYVDLNAKYYINCGFDHELVWYIIKGRRNKYYYYSLLPRYPSYLYDITRMMECCKANPEPSRCNKPIIFCDGYMYQDNSFNLIAEIGNHYQQLRMIPYFALGICKDDFYNRITFLSAIDKDFNFYGLIRYQFQYLSFPYEEFFDINTWRTASEYHTLYRYCKLYIGNEFKARRGVIKRNNYLEHSFHFGFAVVDVNDYSLIPRIFIQYGFGYDYLKNNSNGIYPILQLGVDINLIRFINEGNAIMGQGNNRNTQF